jgi:ribonuclease D
VAGVRLIDRQEELDHFLGQIAAEPLLAVDTEAASFHRYRDRVYLLQISSRSDTAVVDPLGLTSLERFGALLADPAIEIIFHDGDYDLRLLELEYGIRAANLFDTRIAAQLLNEPGVGLAALLEKYLGVRLDKRFQRADWSARPLTEDMLQYAAADTRHLPELRDILREQLLTRGRLEWAEEEFELLTQVRWTPGESEPSYLRLKGAKTLKPRQLAVLRELVGWRDGVAERLDRATFRILNNEPMLTMAKAPPADPAALSAIPGIGGSQIERYGSDILAAVARGMAVPERELPRVERPPRRPPDPELEARVERLKAARNALAVRYDLPPGVLCPNYLLEAIARANPASVEELVGIPGLRRWQVREFGEELLRHLTVSDHP